VMTAVDALSNEDASVWEKLTIPPLLLLGSGVRLKKDKEDVLSNKINEFLE
jgi:hypothetical protein